MEFSSSEHGVLRPIRKAKVYEEIVAEIQRLIAEGRLKPGDRLPPERELASAFGVSRGSVRDAIRALEVMGLVEVRQGDGTVIRELSPEVLVRPLAGVLLHKRQLLRDLLDMRRIIEPPLAARAALRARPEEVARLEEILRRQEAKMARGDLAMEEDSEFHYVIATAARNDVALRVIDVLMDLLKDCREQSLQTPGRRERSLAGHRQVLAAIRDRDPAAAEAAMRRHIDEVGEVLRLQDEDLPAGVALDESERRR